ncbi:MAG: hypothetical protein OEW91_17160 [Acidimicrobiia bacterium]|nr:hypothetical protein [Acidimicrobiia bacterium]
MSLVVPERFCGVAGLGQGGYLAGLMAGGAREPYQVDFRNPIPLDVELVIEQTPRGIAVTHGTTVIAEGKPGTSPSRTPEMVEWSLALAARDRAEQAMPAHVGSCFSCGTRPDSLRVHAGPAGDGRFSTPYVPPAWTENEGIVSAPFVWAPLDCSSGWCLSWDPPRPRAVTGMMTLEYLRDVEPEQDHVVVADSDGPWRARTRRSWSALYTKEGTLVARSESLWVALRQPET